ncbi:MAG: recombinase family protein [Acidimicrobiales bacterium]
MTSANKRTRTAKPTERTAPSEVRVAIYLRISTNEEHQPYSLEAQEHRLGAYVASQPGWSLVRTFVDQASGATLERPPSPRRSPRPAGRYDLLLVYGVDRLARSVQGLAQVLGDLEGAGAAFRSPTEPFDTTTPAGRTMVKLLAVVAEFERAVIIDRVIAGMEREAARGEWVAGARPFGYRIHQSRLVPHEAEAPLVGVIFDLYARQRLGAHSIAERLNQAGHTGPQRQGLGPHRRAHGVAQPGLHR